MDYDRCMVMEQGSVLEFGPPSELMASGGAFASLATSNQKANA